MEPRASPTASTTTARRPSTPPQALWIDWTHTMLLLTVLKWLAYIGLGYIGLLVILLFILPLVSRVLKIIPLPLKAKKAREEAANKAPHRVEPRVLSSKE